MPAVSRSRSGDGAMRRVATRWPQRSLAPCGRMPKGKVRRRSSQASGRLGKLEKKPAKARLLISGLAGPYALVLGEDRVVRLEDGAIRDEFGEYGVHLYKIPDKG